MGEGEYDRGGSRLYIRRAVEASLKRLNTEYIDLYQMHSPDPTTPIEETLSTLNDLVRDGKVRYVGSSNFAGWQIADADWTARVKGFEPFVSAQNHYSLLEREVEHEVIPACEHFGVSMIPYFPLASGMLTGKHRRGEAPAHDSRLAGPAGPSILTDANFDVVERLEDFAQARGLGLLQVAIGALAAQPQVASVIAGAMNPDQVRANAKAAEWVPTLEDVVAVNEITASATKAT
jgi:aryl-alcohol dehydrogenase-like predicted oxidoreductase